MYPLELLLVIPQRWSVVPHLSYYVVIAHGWGPSYPMSYYYVIAQVVRSKDYVGITSNTPRRWWMVRRKEVVGGLKSNINLCEHSDSMGVS